MAEIPNKLHFKIGEVAKITGVKPHVLRYWETEFSALRPQKTRTNQRVYRRRDVEILLTIKQLLYAEGFTIAGANKKINELAREGDSGLPSAALVEEMKHQIKSILSIVEAED